MSETGLSANSLRRDRFDLCPSPCPEQDIEEWQVRGNWAVNQDTVACSFRQASSTKLLHVLASLLEQRKLLPEPRVNNSLREVNIFMKS